MLRVNIVFSLELCEVMHICYLAGSNLFTMYITLKHLVVQIHTILSVKLKNIQVGDRKMIDKCTDNPIKNRPKI